MNCEELRLKLPLDSPRPLPRGRSVGFNRGRRGGEERRRVGKRSRSIDNDLLRLNSRTFRTAQACKQEDNNPRVKRQH